MSKTREPRLEAKALKAKKIGKQSDKKSEMGQKRKAEMVKEKTTRDKMIKLETENDREAETVESHSESYSGSPADSDTENSMAQVEESKRKGKAKGVKKDSNPVARLLSQALPSSTKASSTTIDSTSASIDSNTTSVDSSNANITYTAPILVANRSAARALAAEHLESRARAALAAERRITRERGRLRVTPHEALNAERRLRRVATKGVVHLFNAIRKQQREAGESLQMFICK